MGGAELFQQIVHNYVNINSDEDLQKDDRYRMKERNKKYSEILDVYSENTRKVLSIKRVFRVVFLMISLGALVGTFAVFSIILGGTTKDRDKLCRNNCCNLIIDGLHDDGLHCTSEDYDKIFV